jgi:CRP/FNR family cyclic AMP-dependent transcriptional regulator
MLESVFNQIPVFKDLTPDQHTLLESIITMVACEADEIIFEQGAASDYIYIVTTGEVAIIFKPDDGGPITVARIQKGGVFGWSAAFGSGTYTSGATCLVQSKLLKVLGDDLKKLRQNHPETGILVLERLAAVVAERLRCSATHNQVVALLEHGLMNGIKPIGG